MIGFNRAVFAMDNQPDMGASRPVDFGSFPCGKRAFGLRKKRVHATCAVLLQMPAVIDHAMQKVIGRLLGCLSHSMFPAWAAVATRANSRSRIEMRSVACAVERIGKTHTRTRRLTKRLILLAPESAHLIYIKLAC